MTEQTFKKTLASKIPPAQANAWSQQPAVTSSVGAITQQAMGQAPQSAPRQQPGTSSGLSTLKLTQAEYADYQKWTAWAKKSSVPVEEIFAASATYGAFQAFMTGLEQGRESLPMNATAKDVANYIQQQVKAYLDQSTVSAATGWGGQSPTKVSTADLTDKKPKAAPEKTPQPPWAKTQFTWTLSNRVMHHFQNKDLIDPEGFPTSPQELLDYVEDNAFAFKETNQGTWRHDLGSLITKTYGGAKDLKLWRILLRVTGDSSAEIFHYGPEQLYPKQ